ncbi:uncharacterized protein LOC129565389 [Sitodiplosis mosellana]|uniref:uncharacterized protein LOC129565389 n=1 Tax=Sitodiplosis mosellana TaxID=263140 RepID=UPI0024449E34|nr:uncharacterized protein LOC129565389 [Sitodiplosis mosellana]
MDSCNSSPVFDLPITIGTHPILDATSAHTGNSTEYLNLNNILTDSVISQQPTSPQVRSAPQLPDQNSLSSPPYSAPPSYPYDDLPTYQEAVQRDGCSFKSKYPTF